MTVVAECRVWLVVFVERAVEGEVAVALLCQGELVLPETARLVLVAPALVEEAASAPLAAHQVGNSLLPTDHPHPSRNRGPERNVAGRIPLVHESGVTLGSSEHRLSHKNSFFLEGSLEYIC